jgi:hypothetical protein
MEVCAESIDLFIMAGQSNMVGAQGDASGYPQKFLELDAQIHFYWVTPGYSSSQEKWVYMKPQEGLFPSGHFGPEVTFSRLLRKAGYHPAIFKFSAGSSSLASHWGTPGDGGLYDKMILEYDNAVSQLKKQGHTVEVRAFVWIQGESDATIELADGYFSRLKGLIENIRINMVKNPKLPVITSVNERHPYVKKFPVIVEFHQEIAKGDNHIVFIPMIGLEQHPDTHLTPSGLVEHGKRLFDGFNSFAASQGSR